MGQIHSINVYKKLKQIKKIYSAYKTSKEKLSTQWERDEWCVNPGLQTWSPGVLGLAVTRGSRGFDSWYAAGLRNAPVIIIFPRFTSLTPVWLTCRLLLLKEGLCQPVGSALTCWRGAGRAQPQRYKSARRLSPQCVVALQLWALAMRRQSVPNLRWRVIVCPGWLDCLTTLLDVLCRIIQSKKALCCQWLSSIRPWLQEGVVWCLPALGLVSSSGNYTLLIYVGFLPQRQPPMNPSCVPSKTYIDTAAMWLSRQTTILSGWDLGFPELITLRNQSIWNQTSFWWSVTWVNNVYVVDDHGHFV